MSIVKILSQVVILYSYTCDPMVGGYYTHATQQITVCRGDTNLFYTYSGQNEKHVKAHEMAHYIWFVKMTDEQRKQFKALYDKSNDGDFCSDYAKKNEEEDFAEIFRMLAMTNYRVMDVLSENENSKLKYVKSLIKSIK